MMSLNKILIVKELKAAVVIKIRLETSRGIAYNEIARFRKSGMGYVALGAAGRALINGVGFLDEIRYDGSKDVYDRLVALEVIDPKVAEEM